MLTESSTSAAPDPSIALNTDNVTPSALAIRDAYKNARSAPAPPEAAPRPLKRPKVFGASSSKKAKTSPQEDVILSHKSDANKSAAERLRAMLHDLVDEVYETPPTVSALSDTITPAAGGVLPQAQTLEQSLDQTLKDRLMHQAYDKEYSGKGNHSKHYREMLEGGWKDQTQVWEQSNQHRVGGGVVQPVKSIKGVKSVNGIKMEGRQMVDPARKFELKLFQRETDANQTTSKSLTGLPPSPSPAPGSTRARLVEAQLPERGDIPLVGQQTGVGVFGSEGMAEQLDCDLPAYQEGQYVSLDPDCEPRAADHPARVWNALIHSLSPEMQPIVKWDYERVTDDDGPAFFARMTLILPPLHPAMQAHTLAFLVPRGRYSREYLKVAESLGGARKWIGEARRLKADAQNTTLVRAIADDAMSWVLEPELRDVASTDDEAEPDSSLGESDLGNLAKLDFDRAEVAESKPSCTQRLRAVFKATVANEGGAVWQETVQGDDRVGSVGMTLVIGLDDQVQAYQTPIAYDDETLALEAVCKIALDLNAEGFLGWLVERKEGVSEQDEMVQEPFSNSSTFIAHDDLAELKTTAEGPE